MKIQFTPRPWAPATIAALACLIGPGTAWAEPTVTGQIIVVSGDDRPDDLTLGAYNPTLAGVPAMALIKERTGTLGASIAVDILGSNVVSPLAFDGNTPIAGLGGNLTSGTEYASYLLHFDHALTGTHVAAGTITFDKEIIGVIFRGSRLNLTDAIAGYGATYYKGSGRGIEASGNLTEGDSYTLFTLTDRNTLTINYDRAGATTMDELRIFTAVPEPSTVAMCGMSAALLGVAVPRLRRRRAAAAV